MTTSSKSISALSRVLMVFATGFLIASLFLPIWRIDLDAPQYPEGLSLLIYANEIAGNVDIINGLNHYIGMKTLHTEDFLEFTVLPYCIGFFALLALLAAVIGKKKFLYSVFVLFLLFGIVAMVDFWRWEYNYGHNLDPNAAIIVPGMAYQPPLIGFKQLLNFGAFSVPAIGGWFYILSGLCMLVASWKEGPWLKRKKPKAALAVLVLALPFGFSNCSSQGTEPIRLNEDNCAYCNMTIASPGFACELLTSKGRVFKFDDLSCLMNYKKENGGLPSAKVYVSDYLKPNALTLSDSLYYVSGELVASPMGGSIAAFSNADSAKKYIGVFSGRPANWAELNK